MPLAALLAALLPWWTLHELEDRKVFAPESICSHCQVDNRLILGTNKSRIYTVDLATLQLSKPIPVDPRRYYPNSLWNSILSIATLPGDRIACSYFDEIQVFDFKKGAVVHKVKHTPDKVYLFTAEKFLIGVDWNSALHVYDATTLEKKCQLDLGRGVGRSPNEVDSVSDMCFDPLSKQMFISRTNATSCAVVELGNPPKVKRRFDEERAKHWNRCFVDTGVIYEVVEAASGYRISASHPMKEAPIKTFNLKADDGITCLRALPSGGFAGLFSNPKLEQDTLRLYDKEFVEKQSVIAEVVSSALDALPDGRLFIRGFDGVEIVTLKGHEIVSKKTLRLPYPVKRQKGGAVSAPVR